MKNKITAILACGAFVFLLAGCQSTPKDQAEANYHTGHCHDGRGNRKCHRKFNRDSGDRFRHT